MRQVLAPDPDHALAIWLMHNRGGDVGLRPPAWWADAACAGMDPSRFVGEAGQPMASAAAVCVGCGVRDTCLEYALADPELYTHGVFGGKAPRERRVIGKARGLPTSPKDVERDQPEPKAPRPLAPCGTAQARRRHRNRGETCPTCQRLLQADELRRYQGPTDDGTGVCSCGCGREHTGPGRMHPTCRKRQQRQRASEAA